MRTLSRFLFAPILACLLLAAPVCAGQSQLASDPFTRADSGGTQIENLGANWTTNTAGKFYKLVSNTIIAVDTANDVVERYSGITWPADQYASVTQANTLSASLEVGYGPGCRFDTGGANTGYRLIPSTAGSVLARFNAGVRVQLASDTTAGAKAAAGDVFLLQCTGSATVAFLMTKNGVEFSAGTTDSSGSRLTSGAAALAFSSSSAVVNGDNFVGGAVINNRQVPIIFP